MGLAGVGWVRMGGVGGWWAGFKGFGTGGGAFGVGSLKGAK